MILTTRAPTRTTSDDKGSPLDPAQTTFSKGDNLELKCSGQVNPDLTLTLIKNEADEDLTTVQTTYPNPLSRLYGHWCDSNIYRLPFVHSSRVCMQLLENIQHTAGVSESPPGSP
ncbi:hypothetical protein RRG08_023455 [Elysia crispata]|uniref:Uncharacterized protein n=1 Tax=Elysia crispata TaxID=231223 RepID=A0AAE1ADQ3_9GAST|nr:hypothetical protein RRG08_023455 [Elysia crispata]